MKQWDSMADGEECERTQMPAREALHTAFELPDKLTAIAKSARESCEVRVLVLFNSTLSASEACDFRSRWCRPNPPEYNIFI